jgi:hypothetical protein
MTKKSYPNDRIIKKGEISLDNPEIRDTVRLKIPDKEVHIMQPGEQPPDGGGGSDGGTCSCHSVCTCVPVSTCTCDMVCTCDTVCSTDLCACHPYSGCQHECTCVPVCSCDSHSTSCSSCGSCGYWYPC